MPATPPVALGQPLSVASYCELTIERLRIAHDVWSRASRSPTDDELNQLWRRYGVTAEEYYRFASENRVPLADYLASRGDIAQAIERLAADLIAVIQQREPR
jgi:hypothetical protein